MNYLLDTDHISILQRESGPEFREIASRLAQVDEKDVAVSIVSFHEQTAGANAYVAQARTADDTVHGYARRRSLPRSPLNSVESVTIRGPFKSPP